MSKSNVTFKTCFQWRVYLPRLRKYHMQNWVGNKMVENFKLSTFSCHMSPRNVIKGSIRGELCSVIMLQSDTFHGELKS